MHPTIVARPPARYMGGKRNLAKRLCALIEATPHKAYIEPFVGMGGVFLRRPTPASVEVINDFSGDVANLFRVIRRHYEPFVDELRWLIASRSEFERQRALDPRLLTDIERAVRFLYLIDRQRRGYRAPKSGVCRRGKPQKTVLAAEGVSAATPRAASLLGFGLPLSQASRRQHTTSIDPLARPARSDGCAAHPAKSGASIAYRSLN